MTLADRIRERLDALGISEAEACRRARLAHTYIRNIRKGTVSAPRTDTLDQLARALETTSDWLLTGSGDKTMSGEKAQLIDIWDHLGGDAKNDLLDFAKWRRDRDAG